MVNPADAVQKVWGEILPLKKIGEMGISKGFAFPYTLVAVSLVKDTYENYQVFVADNTEESTTSGSFNMICGTAPTARQPPVPYPPKGSVLIFLFDASRVKFLRFRMEKKVEPLGLEWFHESNSAWEKVP